MSEEVAKQGWLKMVSNHLLGGIISLAVAVLTAYFLNLFGLREGSSQASRPFVSPNPQALITKPDSGPEKVVTENPSPSKDKPPLDPMPPERPDNQGVAERYQSLTATTEIAVFYTDSTGEEPKSRLQKGTQFVVKAHDELARMYQIEWKPNIGTESSTQSGWIKEHVVNEASR